MKYGLFITKEGKNVLQQQTINDYILHSNYNTLKIYKRVEGVIAVPSGGTASTTITHGLGYHPAFIGFYKFKTSGGYSTSSWWPDRTSLNNSIVDNDGYRSEGTFINKSDIRFKARDGSASGARDIYFKGLIFTDPINLVEKDLIGIKQNQGFGFKVSKPGIDVRNAKVHELLISSQFESLKYHTEFNDTLVISAGNTNGSKTFRHNLPYVPICFVMILNNDDTTKQSFLPYGRVPQDIATSVRIDKYEVQFNAVQIVFGSDTTHKFRIIIFKNKLSDD